MELQEVKIEMDSDELISLRDYMLKHGSKDLEPQEIQEVSSGFLREPILISLIVALGGPVIVKEVASLIKEWMRIRHEERMHQMKLSALTLGGDRKIVSLAELEAAAAT
ncbi:MAG: hypothetical protein ACQ9MH_19290 [Nitrospinales bacterium]